MTLLSNSCKVYQEIIIITTIKDACPSLWGYLLPSKIAHNSTLPSLQGCRERVHPPCLLSRVLGKVAAERKLSECPGEQAEGHAVHSQLVDGVLRDDRVGREVGDHVGATKTAGAGGGRLPFPGQRAQDHRTGSEFTGPSPGYRLAPHEKLLVGVGD